jgi:hypothetical protein
MAVKEWTSNYPTSQDTGTDGEDQQPTLVDGDDDTRVSQAHALRKKVHAAALAIGDDSDLPAGCLKARVTALEGAPAGLSDRYPVFQDVKSSANTASFAGYVALHTWETVKDSDNPPDQWYIALTVKVVQVYSETMDVKVTIGSDVREWLGLAYTIETLIFDKIPVGADPTDTLLDCKIEARVSGSGASAYVTRVDIAEIWT